MTKEELQSAIKSETERHENEINSIKRQYADAHNPYKVGDVFTDHIGSILIEKWQYAYTGGSNYNTPSLVYYGSELKKDGTPKKNGSKRNAWQCNDITTKE